MFEDSFLIFLFVGLTSLGVFYYYNRLLQNVLNVLKTLLKLQETRNQNIQDHIASIESHLKEKLGLFCISYTLTYHEKTITKHPDRKCRHLIALNKDIFYDTIKGSLTLHVKNDNGENRIINRLILYVVTLQVVNAIHAEIERINESFDNIAKLQTYMVHDVKNILQFFQGLEYNLNTLETTEEKERFLQHLQESLTPVNKKITNILSLLQISSRPQQKLEIEHVSLHKIIHPLVQRYRLDCEISDDVIVMTNKETLQSIFENILSNIAYKKIETEDLRCSINVEEENEKIVVSIQDSGKPFKSPELVTQPFYTTKKEGLGIGMYQSKMLAKSVGIELECFNDNVKATTRLTVQKAV